MRERVSDCVAGVSLCVCLRGRAHLPANFVTACQPGCYDTRIDTVWVRSAHTPRHTHSQTHHMMNHCQMNMLCTADKERQCREQTLRTVTNPKGEFM